MAQKPVSVSQLLDYLAQIVNRDPIFNKVVVKGEIININRHSTGNIYLSLVEGENKINCYINRDVVRQLRYEIQNGMQIIVYGKLSVYKRGSSFTLFINDIEVEGQGDRIVAFEELKAKLLKEGLFDQKYKKIIPKYARAIGIVTSETGAALQDILKIIDERNKKLNIYIFPALVQGKGASLDIANTIDFVNEKYVGVIDTLIVGRGGGSSDDLWAFNEEVLARSIFNSEIPIITGIGHEIDYTIADFVSDLRAETPTQAAHIAVYDRDETIGALQYYLNELASILETKIKYHKLQLDSLLSDMNNLFETQITNGNNQLDNYYNDMFNLLSNKVSLTGLELDGFARELDSEINNKIPQYEYQLNEMKIFIEQNNPQLQLEKGYSIISDIDNNVISCNELIKDNNTYYIQMRDSKIPYILRRERK